MPQIELNTPSGVSVDINYHISTPTSSSTTLVDQELPCVLFIHAEYLPHEGFEAQFSDPLLRKRFNLISLDLRGYGHTTTLAQADYTPAVAADDIYHFLHALNVSAIHVFGISIGCHVAIELAIAHPEFVSSLTLCTMPPGQEADPPEIMAGRNEVYEFWQDSGDHQGDSTTEVTEDMDEDLITNLVRGIQLMLFGESTVALVEPITGFALLLAKTVWAGSPEALECSHVVLVRWFQNRRVFDVAALSQIKCPVTVIHCTEDVAYTLQDSEEFVALLRDAKVEVDFHQVSSSHFGHVTNPELINPIICERVLSVVAPDAPLPAKSNGTRRVLMESPFKKELMKYGYRTDDDQDTDSSAESEGGLYM